jgi:hypothetical protein
VLTIGQIGDPSPPTVSIRDLTVTGGRTTSSPESLAILGQQGAWAFGGGIDIPPGGPGPIDPNNATPGATITLTRTTITDNATAPSATFPTGCTIGRCFSFGGGGGFSFPFCGSTAVALTASTHEAMTAVMNFFNFMVTAFCLLTFRSRTGGRRRDARVSADSSLQGQCHGGRPQG